MSYASHLVVYLQTTPVLLEILQAILPHLRNAVGAETE